MVGEKEVWPLPSLNWASSDEILKSHHKCYLAFLSLLSPPISYIVFVLMPPANSSLLYIEKRAQSRLHLVLQS